VAQITDGVITPEHAEYLRRKYLFGVGKEPDEEWSVLQQNM